MLGDEYRMVVPGRLFPVIQQIRWRQPLCNEISRMLEDFTHSFAVEIVKFLFL